MIGAAVHADQRFNCRRFAWVSPGNSGALQLGAQPARQRRIAFKNRPDFSYESYRAARFERHGTVRQPAGGDRIDRFQQTEKLLVGGQGIKLKRNNRKRRQIAGGRLKCPILIYLDRQFRKNERRRRERSLGHKRHRFDGLDDPMFRRENTCDFRGRNILRLERFRQDDISGAPDCLGKQMIVRGRARIDEI